MELCLPKFYEFEEIFLNKTELKDQIAKDKLKAVKIENPKPTFDFSFYSGNNRAAIS